MFTYQGTSSITRRRSVRLSSIAEYSRLQPPVGVWTVSQFHRWGSTPEAKNLYRFRTIGNYPTFRLAMPDFGGSTYVLLPRLPVALAGPLDLHDLSTPPAFTLS